MKEGKSTENQRKAWRRELRRVRKKLIQEQKRRKPKQNGENAPQKRKREKVTAAKQEEFYDLPYTRASKEIPIESIRDGVIYTSDGRYVKIVEVLPINFLHRSASEQRNIIYSTFPA